MPILTITDDDESKTELVKLQIPKIHPAKAVVAILKALETVEAPRAPRKDKGTSRTPKPTAQPNLPGA